MKTLDVEALINGGVYCIQPWEINIDPHFYDFNIGNDKQITIGVDNIGGRYFCAINGRYYEKDYGITWALTKEELLWNGNM